LGLFRGIVSKENVQMPIKTARSNINQFATLSICKTFFAFQFHKNGQSNLLKINSMLYFWKIKYFNFLFAQNVA
jgi:hypothetical protein